MAAVGNGDIRLLRGGDDAFFLEQPFTASGGKLLFQLLIKDADIRLSPGLGYLRHILLICNQTDENARERILKLQQISRQKAGFNGNAGYSEPFRCLPRHEML